MEKQIFTIGYVIPALDENHVDFYKDLSLMDADILLVSPDLLSPQGDWVSFNLGDGGCYNVDSSKEYRQRMAHLKKEMQGYLNCGKNIFILLSKKEEYQLATGVSVGKKGERLFSTANGSNYDFLPIDMGTLTSASGKHIVFSGNSIFCDFYLKFKKYLEYQLYIETPNEAQTIFTGKDKTKILGAIYKDKNGGHIVALPFIKYDEDKFTEDKETESYWTDEAMIFGKTLANCIVDIDKQLTQGSEKTPTPDWAKKKEYSTKRAFSIKRKIQHNEQKIEEINSENIQMNRELICENILQDLLYEQGKLLENAVTVALTILGYQAENYDDGTLEIDQVITSPEKHRYIGECEGKDNKDINITKFRQLLESLNADFARDEVKEKAFGILFGNPQRLIDPSERNLDFTQKCKIGAAREKIALVKTTDLFAVAKYIKENNNEQYKKDCRSAIYNGLGTIIEFPKIPNK